MTEFGTVHNTVTIPNMALESEVTHLRKQLRSQEVEFKKCKALMEQKIELLELQNEESKQREENFRKMNNSVMSALNAMNKDPNTAQSKNIRELEYNNEKLTREITEVKNKLQATLKIHEREEKLLNEKINELEKKYNNSVLSYERNQLCLQQQIGNLENEKKNMELIIKLYEEDKKQYKQKENNEAELHGKIAELKFLMERLKDDHKKDLEKVNNEHIMTKSNLKKKFETEKASLELQLIKLQENNKQETRLIEELKKSLNDELIIKKERDDAFKRVQELEKQLLSLSENGSKFEEKFLNAKKEADQQEKQIQKLKEHINDIEQQLKKGEINEKQLKHALNEKDHQIEEIKMESRKKLNSEKKRFEQVQEISKKYKEELQKKNALILQESLIKDETIKKLKYQLASKSREIDKSAKKSDVSKSSICMNIPPISATKRKDKEVMNLNVQEDISNSMLKITPKLETPDMDFTNDNILLSPISTKNLNSQYFFNNATAKGYFEFHSVDTQNNRKLDSHLTMIGPNHKNENFGHARSMSSTIDLKQKNISLNMADNQSIKQICVNPVEESLKHIAQVECAHCNGIYGLSAFVDHVKNCIKNNNEHKSSQDNALGLSDIVNLSRLERVPTQNKIANISIKNFETKLYESKIIELEDKLKSKEYEYEELKLEKENMQVELDRIIFELKQTKMERALTEEKKEESELALKAEIKFLVNKLTQARNNNINNNHENSSVLFNFSSYQNHSARNYNSLGINSTTSYRIPSSDHVNNNNNIAIINNNLMEKIKEKKYIRKSGGDNGNNSNQKEYYSTDLKENVPGPNLKYYLEAKKLNFDEENVNSLATNGDSPRKVSEFHTHENSLVHNLSVATAYPKKLIKNLKI